MKKGLQGFLSVASLNLSLVLAFFGAFSLASGLYSFSAYAVCLGSALGFVIAGAGFLSLYFQKRAAIAATGGMLTALGAVSLFNARLALSASPGIEAFLACPQEGASFLLVGISLVLSVRRAAHRPFIIALGAFVVLFGIAIFTGASSPQPEKINGAAVHAVGAPEIFILLGAAVLLGVHAGSPLGGRSWLLPGVIGFAILASTFALWHTATDYETQNISRNLELKYSKVRNSIHDLTEAQILSLIRMAGRWGARRHYHEDEWKTDASLYLEHFSGLESLELTDPSLKTVMLAGNAPSRSTEKERTLSLSWVQKRVAISAPENGLLHISIPMKGEGAFTGLLIATLDPAAFFEEILKTGLKAEYDLSVHDGGMEVYKSGRRADSPWISQGYVDIYGVSWRVSIWPALDHTAALKTRLPSLILVFGILSSVLVSAVVYLAQAYRSNAALLKTAVERAENEMKERARAQASLKESESRLKDILNNSTAVVSLKDTKGNYLFVNRSFERLFGVQNDSIRGKTGDGVLPREFIDEYRATDLKALSSGSAMEVEESIPHEDGVHTYISLKFPIKDGDGVPYALCVISTDITERKRGEEELKVRSIELARSNSELQEYANVVSHDLKEPLRAVHGYSRLIIRRLSGRLDNDIEEYLSHIMGGAERMQRLIDDLLEYAKVGRLDGEGTVDTASILDRAVVFHAGVIGPSGGLVTNGELPVIRAIGPQIEHLFINLIGNALKYRGETPPRVHVSARRGDGEWVFSVEDNGIGIDPAFSERIFHIFERLHPAGKFPGTGIGLAICKKVVENHGGRIWVESTPGAGSTFYFTIPESRTGQQVI